MNRFVLLFVIFLIGLVQVTVVPHLQIRGISPNLLLIAIIFVALTQSRFDATLSAFLGGLVLDLFSGQFFGIFILSFFLISYLIAIGKFYLFAEINFWIFLMLIFGGTIVHNILNFFFSQLIILFNISSAATFISFKELLAVVPGEILYNLASAAVIFFIINKAKLSRWT